MLRDPYLRAAWREATRRWRSAGWIDRVQQLGLPALAVLVLLPLVRRTFLPFLDAPADAWGPRLVEVVFRADVVALSVVVLDLYEQVVRGRDRAVLETLPVDPARVARLAAVRTLVSLHRFVLGGAVLLAPVAAAGSPALWAAAVGSTWACAVAAVPLGVAGHLLAIRAAEAPALAPALELLRGTLPRAQAALLYGPGAVLLVGGALLRTSADAVPALAAGAPLGGLVFVPLAAGALAWLAVPGLARAAWFRGTIVISEIDARYATLEDPDEARRVYLEWAVRFLPPAARVYALADLRHGWRARRTLLALQWVAAALAAGMALTPGGAGPFRAAAVAVVGAGLVGGVGVQLDADEPALLRVLLPRDPVWSRVARAAALAGWSMPAAVGAALGVAARDGLSAAGGVAAVAAGAVAIATLLSLACGQWRERGLRVYAPAAAVALAGWLAAWGGPS